MSTEFDAGDAVSDSDLSDVRDVVVADPVARASSSSGDEMPTYTEAVPDISDSENQSESDSPEDNASDDGDYDMDDSPPSPQSDGADDTRSSSQASRRASKRKAAVEEDYIQQNPELYGLRRSVWIFLPFICCFILLNAELTLLRIGSCHPSSPIRMFFLPRPSRRPHTCTSH